MGNGDFWKSLFGSRPAKNDSGSGGTTSTQDTTVQTGTDAKSTNAVQENGGYPLGLGTVPVGLNGDVYWDASGLYGNGSGSSTVLPNGEKPKYTGYTYSAYGTDDADPWLSSLWDAYQMDEYHSDKKDEYGEYAFFDDDSVKQAINDALGSSTDFADIDLYTLLTHLSDEDYGKLIAMDPMEKHYDTVWYRDADGNLHRGNPIDDSVFFGDWRGFAHDNPYGQLYADNDFEGMYLETGYGTKGYRDSMKHVAGYDPFTGEFVGEELEGYVPPEYLSFPSKDFEQLGPSMAETMGIDLGDSSFANPASFAGKESELQRILGAWSDAMLANENWDADSQKLRSYNVNEYDPDEGAPVVYDTDMTAEDFAKNYSNRTSR